MEETIEKTNIAWKKNKNNLKSVVFLIIVIMVTVWLKFYNNSLYEETQKIKTEISSYDSRIKEVQKDKKIQIYTLLELNNSVIRGYKLMNKISTYINHMKYIETKYWVKFSWFGLNDLTINSKVKIISDDKAIAYQKTRDFLKKYRVDPNALFNLKFVNQIEWMDEMKFKVEFDVKG